MINPVTIDKLHFEDLSLGQVFQLTSVTVTKDMIVTFATEFDPLPFHLDETAARKSLLGGLAASGWQTAALSLRMLVDAFLGDAASMGGLGFSNLKWRKPVMVGDSIGGKVTIAELRPSQSNPNWGIVTLDFDIRNQRQQQVLSMQLNNLVEVRVPQAQSEVAS